MGGGRTCPSRKNSKGDDFTAFLVPDRIREENSLVIKEKIIPDGSPLKANKKLCNGTGEVKYITVHNTDSINEAPGTTDAEQYVRSTFNGNMGDVTVHYYIDDRDCWQMLKEDEKGWHSASEKGNSESLAIEIIMDGSGSESDILAEKRGAALAALLLKKHSLGIESLTTHNFWYPPKYCPAYILPHWDSFVEEVRRNMEKSEGTGLFLVQSGAFKSRENAEEYAEKLRSSGFPAFVTLSGDVNGDGSVSSADAREVLRKAVGLEDEK